MTANPASSVASAGGIGATSLVYRYTVTGSSKSSIDTGVDTADAGDNNWQNGNVLEVYVYGRDDSVNTFSSSLLTFNNDSSAIYDRINMRDTNTTLAQDNSLAQTSFAFNLAGASLAAGVFGVCSFVIANYQGTVANKFGYFDNAVVDTAAATTRIQTGGLGYRSATALSRLKIIPLTGGAAYIVGTQIMIYKRTAS